MGLSELAAGLEVTESQEERGVATVDTTGTDLAERLEQFAERLPCTPAEAETVLERYAAGASVGTAAHTAGVAPVTAAKTLHLLGESVSPLGPTGREILRDWLAGELSRTEAVELARVGEAEFALATYVETHEPIEAACAAVEGVLAADRLTEESPLADATGDTTEFL
ncbi:MAG: hypothetical protein J07HX64_02941 [halophilic archaeon J07HX64]|jgi:hypothetical protein|nr:MAG: hypothetical protein J07HX64_02941 [halophilic archaeon J07HX64]